MPRAVASAVAAGIALTGLVGTAPPASAAGYTVTTLANTGPGSLRQAIEDANDDPGTDLDVISFASSVRGTIHLDATDGEMVIEEPVTIVGPGRRALTIDGGGQDHAFLVDAGTGTTTISGLTITGGAGSGNPFGDDGASSAGAIHSVESDLVLDDVALTGNSSVGPGGALCAWGGTLTVTDSVITGNHSDDSGGGIYLAGTVASITDSDISGNSSPIGGGLYVLYDSTLAVSSTTISGNTAEWEAGGLSVRQSTAEFSSTTVSDNTTPGVAGGLDLLESTVDLDDVQVTGNTATEGGGGFWSQSTSLRMTGGVLADNTTDGAGGGGHFDWGYDEPIRGSGELTAVTISGNTSATLGGGLYAARSDLDVADSTFEGNGAGDGAAILSTDDSDLTATNVTMTGHSTGLSVVGLNPGSATGGAASFDHVTLAGNGTTGIRTGSDLPVEVTNSIVDGSGGPDFAPGPSGWVVSHSLLGTAPGVPDGVDGNLVGVDPALGPLADNGGPTRTMRPGADSPVVDAGDPAFAGAATDQRGRARVANPLSTGAARTDMGAVELVAADLPRRSGGVPAAGAAAGEHPPGDDASTGDAPATADADTEDAPATAGAVTTRDSAAGNTAATRTPATGSAAATRPPATRTPATGHVGATGTTATATGDSAAETGATGDTAAGDPAAAGTATGSVPTAEPAPARSAVDLVLTAISTPAFLLGGGLLVGGLVVALVALNRRRRSGDPASTPS